METPLWNRDPPTLLGWYWWKRLQRDQPEVVNLREGGFAFFAAWGTCSDPEKLKGYWWSEPIKPPAERE